MLQPMHNNILVRADAPKSHPLLILPDEDTNTGTVVAAGPGKRRPDGSRAPMMVQVGDRIMFSGTIDRKITENGEDFLLMQDNDVIGSVDG